MLIGVKIFPVGNLCFPEFVLLLGKKPITDVVGQEQLNETSDDYFSCKCKQDQNVLYNSKFCTILYNSNSPLNFLDNYSSSLKGNTKKLCIERVSRIWK